MLPKLLLPIFLCISINTVYGSNKNTPVKLDVGGTVFKTSKHTLMKHEGLFKTMFEAEEQPEKDDNGCIFIDRSPKHFDVVVTYMRDGFVTLSHHEHIVQDVLLEAEYYKLKGLEKLCQAKILELTLKKQVSEKVKEAVEVTVATTTATPTVPLSTTVILNIGGTKFETLRSTVASGLLKTKLEENPTSEVFIDRDPKLFHHVLNFLRNNDTMLPSKYEEIQEIREEAEYYKLNVLADYCNEVLATTMRFIEDDKHYFEVLLDKEKRVLIFHFLLSNVQINYDLAGFEMKQILEKYHNKIDIYFRPVTLNSHYSVSTNISPHRDLLWSLHYNGTVEICKKGKHGLTLTGEIEQDTGKFLKKYPVV